MLRLLLLLFSIFMHSNLSGQVDGLQQVSGSNIFIDPPPSFTDSENFKGFQDPENPYAMVMVIEMPGPYAEISKGFSAEMMGPRGMKLNTKEDFNIGGYEGVYIELDQDASGFTFTKAIVIFGDESKTTIVNGTCLKENTDLFKEMKKSIKSTTLDTSIIVDPRAELDFTVDEKLGDLQFVSVIGNGLLFNRDGIIPTESEDELNIFVDKSYADATIRDRESFSRNRLAQYPGNYMLNEETGITDIELDGLEGKALFAQKKDRLEETMYQIILFNDDGGYYILNSVYLNSSDKPLQDIKNVLGSFKRK